MITTRRLRMSVVAVAGLAAGTGASAAVDPTTYTYTVLLGRRDNQQIVQTAVLARPAVTGVSSLSGPVAGGEHVVITGAGFLTAARVVFGHCRAISYTIDSDDQITAVAPPHPAGVVQVRVKAKGLSARGPHARYRYTGTSAA